MIGVVAYILLQFVIGAAVARSIRTEADYINAGRRIGIVLGAFTVFATWFGAEVIVGTAGEVYEKGLSGAQFDPFGYAVSLFIAGFFFAGALWRQGLTTFGDFFAKRFGARAERLVVVLLVPGSVFWAAAQIRAFGQVVSSVSWIDAKVAVTLAAIVVCAYTVLGGLLADAITDMVQGIAILIGLAILAYLTAQSLGGLQASLADIPVSRLTVLHADAQSPLLTLEHWLIPVCGTIVAVELVSRILGCRSDRVAARATILGAALYLCVGILPVYIGLVAPALLPGLEGDGLEQVMPQLAQKLMPGALYIVFAGAIISAILSTVDSTLVAAASMLSHNGLLPMLRVKADRMRLLLVRVTVVALGALSYLLAMIASSIRDLVETAAALGSSGVVVCVVFGLFTAIGGEASALTALIVGAAVWAAGSLTGTTEIPYTLAVLTATLAYLGIAFMDKVRPAKPAFREKPTTDG